MCDLVHAQTYRFCGSPLEGNAFNRPIDYNDKTKDSLSKIRLVERYHFTPKVESLQEGESGAIELDLAYTLRQIPNHYRALATMARWQAAFPSPTSTVCLTPSTSCWSARSKTRVRSVVTRGGARLRAESSTVVLDRLGPAHWERRSAVSSVPSGQREIAVSAIPNDAVEEARGDGLTHSS